MQAVQGLVVRLHGDAAQALLQVQVRLQHALQPPARRVHRRQLLRPQRVEPLHNRLPGQLQDC